MTKVIALAVVGAASLLGAGLRAQEQPAGSAPAVREIATDSLRDVAVAIYDARGSVIYYNPILMQKLGPLLSAFFMAHERGHLHYHHTRANALSAGRASRDSVLQLRELEADCYAALQLARENRTAAEAAARFFSRMGPFRFDAEHPTGAQRAAKILSCLPVSGGASVPNTDPVPSTLAPERKGGGVDWSPSGEAVLAPRAPDTPGRAG